MGGFPGCGKSTLAKKISKDIGAIVIDRDVIKTTLMAYPNINEDINDISYRLMFDMANAYLGQGVSVVLDTPCYYQDIILKGQSIAEENNVAYKFIECVVEDFNLINNRLKHRKRLPSQIQEASLKAFKRAKVKALRPVCHIKVNTSNSDLINYDHIYDYIG